ncbi:MAG: GNAT family N-acetyltransferase, partial [archaeon]
MSEVLNEAFISQAGFDDAKNFYSLISKEFSYLDLTLEKVFARLSSKNSLVYKLTIKDKFAGLIDFQINGFEGFVFGVAVEEDFRGQGLGETLLDFALDYFKQQAIKEVKLLVRKENTAAKRLYLKKGFKLIGLHDKPIDGAIVEEMVLTLDS